MNFEGRRRKKREGRKNYWPFIRSFEIRSNETMSEMRGVTHVRAARKIRNERTEKKRNNEEKRSVIPRDCK